MIGFVLPTRDRHERLAQTLEALGRLTLGCEAEVVVVDNASARPVAAPAALANGARVRVVRLEENLGAAARNVGVERTTAGVEWVVMLDDDSHPVERREPFAAFVGRLGALPREVGAVSADIHLPARGCREAGGLPEVFVGCGAALRRSAFVGAGGYDASFGYYVEEYDLAAKLLLRGGRVVFDRSFLVHHHKVDDGRDVVRIVERLVRNNGWVMQRYAPEQERRGMLLEQRRRYRAIAEKEHALDGYRRGLVGLRATLALQQRRPMTREVWERFTGVAHARAAIRAAWRERPFRTVAIVEPGKNCWAVERAVRELAAEGRVELVTADRAEAVLPGTLSPGPMLDAVARWERERRRVIAPWDAGAERPLRAVA